MLNISGLLKDYDLKVTPQRVAIVEELYTNGHMNIDEIYKKLIQRFPSVSLATIYKNINSMVERVFLSEVKIPNEKSVYELIKTEHAHLVCKGSVELFEAEHLDGAQSSERTSLGIYKQGDILLVPCNKSHSVMALEDDTFCACVQAVRDSETKEIVSAFNDGTTWKAPSRIVL